MLLGQPPKNQKDERFDPSDLPPLATLEEIDLADRREIYLGRRAERDRLNHADARASRRHSFDLFRDRTMFAFWIVFTLLSLFVLLASVFLRVGPFTSAASGGGTLGGAIALARNLGAAGKGD
jgi:hypothetical protein